MDKDLKYYKVNDSRIIQFYTQENNVCSVEEHFIRKDELRKSFALRQNEGYTLSAWINATLPVRERTKGISFTFDTNHPLYLPLLHLLREDESLTIDDDDTRELNKKYVTISKEENKIVLAFVNNLENINQMNKFNVFIKNENSKIDYYDKDTKERLQSFFKEAIEIIEYKQISIEEYLIRNNPEDEQTKVYIKTLMPTYTNR